MLTENFNYSVEKLGPPRDSIHLNPEQSNFARQHLPGAYCDFLDQYGYGNYFNRGIQLCDPMEFRSILALIFQADKDFNHLDCHVVSYSAFGELKVWSERHWVVKIDLLQYQIWCHKLFPTKVELPSFVLEEPQREVTADFVSSSLLPSRENNRELWDISQQPMFNRCVKEHGALKDGECFGFTPSLGFTGYESKFRSVEYAKRVKALEYFSIISQIKSFQLTRLGPDGYEYGRIIGT